MALDTKYRPKKLDQCIGHEVAVTKIRGFLKLDKMPSLFIITGPTSAGKTTLGRIIAGELNGYGPNGEPYDYQEADGGSYRTKEEMLSLVRQAQFMPQRGKYRVILIDEFQHVLGNANAVPPLLKATEEPPPKTIWILCTMDPTKLVSDKNGKALLNRSVQIPLEQHTNEDLFKQGVRIVKNEKMGFINPDLLKIIVRESNREMRTLAHNLEGIAAFYAGLSKPRPLTEADIQVGLKAANAQTENVVKRYLTAVYGGSFVEAAKAIMDIEDDFSFVNQALWAAKFMLYVNGLGVGKHKKVLWYGANKEVHEACKKLQKKPNVGDLAAVVTMLIKVKSMVSLGNIDDHLLSATFNYMNGED